MSPPPSAPEIGTFMHYVLEKTAREVKRRGGFAAVDDKTLRELCDRFTAQYVSEELNDFNGEEPPLCLSFQPPVRRRYGASSRIWRRS